MQLAMYRMTWASLVVLAMGIFTSVTFSALSHILLVVPAIYFTVQHFKTPNRPKLSMSSWALLGLIVSIILSVIFNWDIIDRPLKNISKIKYFLIPLMGVFAFRETFKNYIDNKKIKFLLNLFIVVTSIATISGLIGLYTGFNPLKMKDACHATRACGLYGMYMTYGYGISLFMVLMTGLVIYRKKLNEFIIPWVLYSGWIIGMAGLILSYARGGWLGFILAVPFFFFKENIKRFVSVIALMGVISTAAFLFSEKVQDTLSSRATSNNQRLAFYEAAYKGFKEKPVFGWGYRNFEPNMKEVKKRYNIAYPTFGSHAHNNILEHLASTGALGVFACIAFFILWLSEVYRRDDLIGKMMFPFVISFLTSGMVQYTFGDGENLFLIMGLWGMNQITKGEEDRVLNEYIS